MKLWKEKLIELFIVNMGKNINLLENWRKNMNKKIISSIICILLIIVALPFCGTSMIIEEDYSGTYIAPNNFNQINIKNTQFIFDTVLRIKDNIESLNINSICYAYCVADYTHQLEEGPVEFLSTDPGNISQLALTTSNSIITSATWTNEDGWYAAEWGATGDTNIWKIDNKTGLMTLIGDYDPLSQGISLNGIAYDPITGLMYGCTNKELFIINMTNGASNLVGSFGLTSSVMIGITFDNNGMLYGEDTYTDSLYQINISTGTATLIGSLGINIEYAQDIAYDMNTNTLYLSAYTKPEWEGALYICNVTTGAATKVGQFQGKAQITGFAIPYGSAPPPDTVPPESRHITIPSSPDGFNGWFKSDVKLSIHSNDDGSGVQETNYSIDNGLTWKSHSGPDWPIEIELVQGEYNLLYYSVDRLGNTEETHGPFKIKIDTTLPNVIFFTIPLIGGGFNIAVIGLGLAKDGYSGLQKVRFFLNDEFHHDVDLTRWPIGFICPIFWPHEGPYKNTYKARVYDRAGNWQDS